MSKRYWIGLITFTACLIARIALFPHQGYAQAEKEYFRPSIEEMKVAPKGPFSLIRWFCEDREVLPPTPSHVLRMAEVNNMVNSTRLPRRCNWQAIGLPMYSQPLMLVSLSSKSSGAKRSHR